MEKINYTLLALFLPLMSLGQNLNWQTINLPFAGRVNSILFIDSLKGYATQENKLLKTLDGGNSWSMVDSLIYSNLLNKRSLCCFRKNNDTLLLTGSGYRMPGSNYGLKGNIIKLKIDSSQLLVDSISKDAGFLNSRQFIGTLKVGIDSNQSLISYKSGVKQVLFQHSTAFEINRGNIIAADYNNLYLSTDTTNSWDTINLPTTFSFYSPNYLNYFSQDTFSVHYNGFPREEYITFNQGANWQPHDTVYTRRPWRYHLTDKSGEVIGNYGNVFLYSNNYGFSFYPDTIAQHVNGNSFSYLDTYINKWGMVIIYGDSGKIYKTTNYDQITALTEKKKRIPTIRLSPNPTNESFKISPAVCHSISEVSIYNQKGQIVKTLKKPCNEINVSDFESGIYILSGLYQNQRFSSKIVVQKE